MNIGSLHAILYIINVKLTFYSVAIASTSTYRYLENKNKYLFQKNHLGKILFSFYLFTYHSELISLHIVYRTRVIKKSQHIKSFFKNM